MRKLLAGFALTVLFCSSAALAQSVNINSLKQVNVIHLDEKSFKIGYSSCSEQVGKFTIPCERHRQQLESFVRALEKRLIKYDIAITRDPTKADAFLQGEISIDESYNTKVYDPHRPPGLPKRRASEEPQWTVNAWLANVDTFRLWKSDGYYPTWSGPILVGNKSQVEGKQLAKEFEVELKRAKKK